MNTTHDGLKNSRRLAALLCVIFTGMAIYFYFTTRFYNDYYRLFGFYIKKRSLSLVTWMLALSMGRAGIPAYFPFPLKKTNASWAACVGIWCFFLAIPAVPFIRDMRNIRRTQNHRPTSDEQLGNISPLMMAAYKGDLQEMERLIKSGADVNARNNINNTALHFAAGAFPVQNRMYRGSPSAVAYLIAQGADVNAEDSVKNTPLIDAVMNNNLESVKILVAHGADVNKGLYQTALSLAVQEARPISDGKGGLEPFSAGRDIVIELLQHGADPNVMDTTGLTPLQMAEGHREADLVTALKDHGASK